MSADDWARCPRCKAEVAAALEARQAEIDAMYGAVPVAEFDEARRQLALRQADFADSDPTFREDYEIYGAEDGVVRVEYRGQCTQCALTLRFEEQHPIPDLLRDR